MLQLLFTDLNHTCFMVNNRIYFLNNSNSKFEKKQRMKKNCNPLYNHDKNENFIINLNNTLNPPSFLVL